MDTSPAPDNQNVPRHVAVIMDGNGRWAKQRGMSRTEGHKAGLESIRRTVAACQKRGIKYLTLYAFSTDNWKRPKTEVAFLMQLMASYLKKEINKLHEQNVRFTTIGNTEAFAANIQKLIQNGKEKTAANSGLTLVLALNYGGRDEIVRAVRKIAEETADGKIQPNEITAQTVADRLYTAGIPDPDLLIRTSGEIRVSDFLLWQISYAEFWFTDIFWPDFNETELEKAITDYQNRHRRFGGTQ